MFLKFINTNAAFGFTLAVGFLTAISLLSGCKQKGAGSTQQTEAKTGHTGMSGSMPMDCTVCKQPSRADLLMGSKQAGSGADSGSLAGTNAGAGKGIDTAKMAWIKPGSFRMGSGQFEDAQPVHKVSLKGYYMDIHEVTNDQFARFVDQTHYITVAERPLNPKDFPGVPVKDLVPGSGVFSPPAHPVSLNDPMQWWKYIAGADWRHPKGPGSTINGKGKEPVVQVCYEDCLAYARWAGKRLPTEAEWEYAAKAGHDYPDYYWGRTLLKNGHYMANNFQGHFPDHNTLQDGYKDLAPICVYPPNEYGLYDMEGNAWEWCSDFYRPDYYGKSPASNPQGPTDSYDPSEPNMVKRVQRGGSFLCSDEYCIRYKTGARGKGEPGSASNNLGFRLVKDK